MEVSGQLHATPLYFSGRDPLYRWLGGWGVGRRAGLDAMTRKILPLPGIDFRSSGPYPSRYTNRVTSAPKLE